MKKTAYYYLSLAAIVAGGMTSCQDENQGFEESEIRTSVYERSFFKEFGNPAPDHQWGFDAAAYGLGLTSPMTRAAEDHMKKQDMMVNNVNVLVAYSKPADITENEHKEVAAWFHNHKVTWTNTPTNFDGVHSTRQNTGVAKVIDDTHPNYGTLLNHTNPLDDYTINPDILFHNGWVQHVSSIKTNINMQCSACDGSPLYVSGDEYYVRVGENKYKKVGIDGNVIDSDTYDILDSSISLKTISDSPGGHMDHLNFLGLSTSGGVWTEHLLDFNNATGKGYGDQSGQNAILVLDADFNTWAYKCSLGTGTPEHDKYYCVYLEGDDYAGYYLGFDFESMTNGNYENNKRVAADGICDDWIIKIGDAGSTQYKNARILCEDLGTNDFDFNDVVFDVDVEDNASFNKGTVKLTLRAVGGTIPVCLCYGTHPSGSVEENAITINGKHELHDIMGVSDYTIPINVNAKGGRDNVSAVQMTLRFGDSAGGQKNSMSYPNEKFDLQKINIYVKHSQKAEWLLVRNYDAPGAVSAPQKICVPQSVAWPTENQPIKEKYPKFKNWVENPTLKFWE